MPRNTSRAGYEVSCTSAPIPHAHPRVHRPAAVSGALAFRFNGRYRSVFTKAHKNLPSVVLKFRFRSSSVHIHLFRVLVSRRFSDITHHIIHEVDVVDTGHGLEYRIFVFAQMVQVRKVVMLASRAAAGRADWLAKSTGMLCIPKMCAADCPRRCIACQDCTMACDARRKATVECVDT